MRYLLFVVCFVCGLAGVGQAIAQDAGHALAQKFAVDDRKLAATKPATARPATAADALKDDEKEMLDAARAEAAARQKQAAPETGAAAPPASAAVPQVPTPTAPAPGTPQAAAQNHAAPAAIVPATDAAQAAAAPQAARAKASLLIVLTQHAGEDASPRTFDPIICVGPTCYVSTGAAEPAHALPRQSALSTKNAMAEGAGACEGQLGCVFRAVAIEPGSALQIVDLGLVEHKHHEPFEAKADGTCVMNEGELVCHKPVTTPDYRLWIVPEAVAVQAGADKLTAALDNELPEENVSLETDK